MIMILIPIRVGYGARLRFLKNNFWFGNERGFGSFSTQYMAFKEMLANLLQESHSHHKFFTLLFIFFLYIKQKYITDNIIRINL